MLLALLGSISEVRADRLDTLLIDRVEVLGSRLSSQSRGSFGVDSLVLSTSIGSTLGDLLRDATPVVIKDYGRGQRQSISFRGAASTHTSLYWNSLKVNSPVIGDVDFSLLPAAGLDGVSVAPGVSAIAYGDGALGGVVDMHSKAQWDDPFSLTLLGSVGSFSTYDGVVALRVGGSRFQSSTKVVYNYSLNDFEFINRDIIDPSNPTYRPTQKNLNGDYRNLSLVQDFFYKLRPNQEISLSVMATDNMRNLPQLTTYEGSENSNLISSGDRALRAVVNYSAKFEHFNIDAMIGGTIEDSEFNQENLRGAGVYDTYIASTSFGRTLQGGVDISYRPTLEHTLLLKLDGALQSASSHEEVRGTGFDRSRTEFSAALDWSSWWGSKVSTSLLARAGVVGGELYGTGYAALNYIISKESELFVRGGYNQHFPTLQDMYYTPGGNPDLRPERGLTAELGGRYVGESLRATVNLFGSVIDDWIIWLPTHAQYWTPTNLKRVLSIGVEAQVNYHYRIDSHWRVDLAGTMNFSRTVNIAPKENPNDYSQWQQLPYVPLLSGALSAGIGWRKLSLNYSLEGESGKYSAMSSNPNSLSQIEPYVIHSLALSYSPLELLSITAQCENIFDSRFYGILRRPMPPRSFTLTLKYTL